MTVTDDFRAARDRLLALREDYGRAREEFQWPRFEEFNFALDWFDRIAADPAKGSSPALVIVEQDGSSTRRTFAELAGRSNQVANWLRSQGVRRGDRMIIMLGNQVELWELMLAGIKLGIVMIPTTTLMGPADLQDRRVVEDLGLAAILHPWESGLDNSPLWDAPLAKVPSDLTLLQRYTRRDLAHAATDERPSDEDYARYIRLARAYRDAGYDDAAYATQAEFRVVDPLFNAMWAWSEEALADIAEAIDADSEPHRQQARELTRSLVRWLFDETVGTFVTGTWSITRGSCSCRF